MAENNPIADETPLKIPQIIAAEKNQLLERRRRLGIEHGDETNRNWFGIALSGGGIRSATTNLGVLKTLHKFGILERADYLSTVSGGGYCGSFVQTTVRAEGKFDSLFDENKTKKLREHGDYMAPGVGGRKNWNNFIIAIAYLVSTLMSFVSPGIVLGIGFFVLRAVDAVIPSANLSDLQPCQTLLFYVEIGIFGLILAHLVVNLLETFGLSISKKFNEAEGALSIVALILLVLIMASSLSFGGESGGVQGGFLDLLLATSLFLVGYFTNPNAISFHRFYRNQLADCFMQFADSWKNEPLKDLFSLKNDRSILPPYPLINTCLNLQNPKGDDKFKGAKASDYFLLSPLFIGSKLTGYVPADRYKDYAAMTLPAATTISAAAVNPGMGIYSNKLLSAVMTVLNVRLGFWVSNPLKIKKLSWPEWWPKYFFYELLSSIGTDNKMVNISDGGHIENLAVYELLRRRCSLILAVDAGEDALYTFADLENLVVRARNELGIEIKFREQPEDKIRPRPSSGYSEKRFVVADLSLLWDDIYSPDGLTVIETKDYSAEPKHFGTLVYLKSSVTAPTRKPNLPKPKEKLPPKNWWQRIFGVPRPPLDEDELRYDTYKYKIYHPAFPHESTADQFFDPVQWESYFQLGQYMGADALGVKTSLDKLEYGATKFSVEELLAHFAGDVDLFAPKMEESSNESFVLGGEPEAAPSTSRDVSAAPTVAEDGYRM